jgi:hypothetical protein
VIFLLFLTSIFVNSAYAEETNPDEELKSFESNLVPIPVIYYTPETGIAGGATLIYTYQQTGQKRSSQKSSIFPAIIFTQNKQTIFVLRSRHSYGQDEWRHNSVVFHSIYPNKYFGIGDATDVEDVEIYDSTNNRFSFGLSKRIIQHLYLGLRVIYRKTQITEIEDEGLLDREKPVGFEGGREQGVGYFLDFDSADDNFNPTKGVRAQLSINNYQESYGSTYNFKEILFYVRHYMSITESGQLAFAISAQDKVGDIPFTSLAQLGGQRLLRGVFQGRYRDKSLGSLQLEWREKVSAKLGWVVFSSVGHVANEFHRLTTSRAILAFGGGIRFTVNEKANTVIRIDSGLTSEGYGGTYFGIGQAF